MALALVSPARLAHSAGMSSCSSMNERRALRRSSALWSIGIERMGKLLTNRRCRAVGGRHIYVHAEPKLQSLHMSMGARRRLALPGKASRSATSLRLQLGVPIEPRAEILADVVGEEFEPGAQQLGAGRLTRRLQRT